MMKKYASYRLMQPMGFYRWSEGSQSVNDDFQYAVKIEKNLYDFREYVYRKNLFYFLLGTLFRQEHFIKDVNALRYTMDNFQGSSSALVNFGSIMEYKENKLRHLFFRVLIKLYYLRLKCLPGINIKL
jgi:hypothetical protein